MEGKVAEMIDLCPFASGGPVVRPRPKRMLDIPQGSGAGIEMEMQLETVQHKCLEGKCRLWDREYNDCIIRVAMRRICQIFPPEVPSP